MVLNLYVKIRVLERGWILIGLSERTLGVAREVILVLLDR